MLANSFLWTRGYTTVWTGWENNLGPLNGLVATAMLPVAFKDKISQTITGPGYEYIVTGAASFTLAYPAASSDKTNAKLTHRVHLDDPPQDRLGQRVGVHRCEQHGHQIDHRELQ